MNSTVRVMKNYKVKSVSGICSLNLGYRLEHSHRLQRCWSDSPPDVAYHKILPRIKAQQVSWINTRIDAANNHCSQCRHHGQARDETMRRQVGLAFCQSVNS